jgi:hypothetical protein
MLGLGVVASSSVLAAQDSAGRYALVMTANVLAIAGWCGAELSCLMLDFGGASVLYSLTALGSAAALVVSGITIVRTTPRGRDRPRHGSATA